MRPQPDFACKCLNVRIYVSQSPKDDPPTSQDDGFEWIYVQPDGISISHEQLVQRVRQDEHGILVCRLCYALVGQIKEQQPDPQRSSQESRSSSRERPQPESFTKQQRWIQVCISPEGCLSGRALSSTMQQVSQIFDLVVPVREPESPIPTPPVVSPPPAALAPHLNNLPEMFPPPPFVPSHQVFTHLARVAKKQSGSFRAECENDIAAFIQAKRREVLEFEGNLKADVNVLWKTWKETQARQLPRVVSHDANGRRQNTTIIREFDVDVAPPKARYMMASSAPVYSALSTSLRQSGLHMPRPLSPPSELSPNFEMDTPTSSPSRIRNQRTQTSGSTLNVSSNSPQERLLSPRRTAMKTHAPGNMNQLSASLDQQSSMQPSVNSKKRKAVTFNNTDLVVTVTREIASERMQRIKEEQAQGEEPMFDMDDEQTAPTSTSPPTGVSEAGVSNLSSQLAFGSVPQQSTPLQPSNGTYIPGFQSVPKSSSLSTSQRSHIQKDVLKDELMNLMGGQTPTHRSAWLRGDFPLYKNAPQEEDPEAESDDEDTEEEEDFIPSTSVPIAVPSMRPSTVSRADSSLQAAMSRSVDPGPTLDMDVIRGRGTILPEDNDDEQDEAGYRAAVALQPERGSLHAKRILERDQGEPPASMWRSLA